MATINQHIIDVFSPTNH